jgi:hypothetical protein
MWIAGAEDLPAQADLFSTQADLPAQAESSAQGSTADEEACECAVCLEV